MQPVLSGMRHVRHDYTGEGAFGQSVESCMGPAAARQGAQTRPPDCGTRSAWPDPVAVLL